MSLIITRNISPHLAKTKNCLINHFSSKQSPPSKETQGIFFKTITLMGAGTGCLVAMEKARQKVDDKDWTDLTKKTAIASAAIVGTIGGAAIGVLTGGYTIHLNSVKSALATLTSSIPFLVSVSDLIDKSDLKDKITEYKIGLIKTAIDYLSEKEISLQNEINALKESKSKK